TGHQRARAGNTADGGDTAHAGNGGTMDPDGGTDGSTKGTVGNSGTIALDAGKDASTSGTTGSGGSHANNDAGTSIVQQPHNILYWGDYGANARRQAVGRNDEWTHRLRWRHARRSTDDGGQHCHQRDYAAREGQG